MRQTMEQRRAAYAWSCVSQIEAGQLESYLDVARKFPTMVQTNGLGQAVAFLKSKGSGPHTQMLRHVEGWLCDRHDAPGLPLYPVRDGNDRRPLAARIAEQDSQRLRLATVETLHLAVWIKRFTEGRSKS